MRRLRDETENEDDDVPLHHKKPFGSGLKRSKVEFVRATEPDLGTTNLDKGTRSSDVGDLYASIVLGRKEVDPVSASSAVTVGRQPQIGTASPAPSICPTCSLPITTSLVQHEASLAHQVSVPHSHPPSALDRSRMGLRALEARGWDPDARRGLGREGQGVQYPVKARTKDDTLGVGATASGKQAVKEAPSRTLSAEERKAEMAREKSKAERLQADIYGRVDVDSYLWRKMDD